MKINKSALRATFVALVAFAGLTLATSAVRAAGLPGSLWYNGDFDGVNGLANGSNATFGGDSAVYDDFNVTDAPGWNISAVYSNDLLGAGAASIVGANWEIRSGVSEGNGGTLLYSGTVGVGPNLSVSATGRSGFGLNEFSVEVTGLNIQGLMPGTYWLNVQPIGNGTGASYNSSTIGANSVGTPGGNNANAFITANAGFGTYYFHTTTDPVFAPGDTDFSDGVIGTVVPEPTTWVLLAGGLALVLVAFRRRRLS